MKRKNFLELFDPLYCDESYNYTFDLDLPKKSNDNEVVSELKKVFPVNVENEHDSLFKVFPDWIFMDDNPEEEGWRYQAKINLNELYDSYNFIDEHKEVTIFRLCNESQTGIYDLGLGYKYLKTGEGPNEDPNLKIIFPKMFTENEYAKKWFFGCKDLDQIKIWLDNPLALNDLDKFGLKVAEIKISEKYVIEGKEQVIYLPEKINSIVFHPLAVVHTEPMVQHRKMKM